jgi:hypothetical protein
MIFHLQLKKEGAKGNRKILSLDQYIICNNFAKESYDHVNWFIICNVFTKDSYDHMNWNRLAICVRQEESIKWYIPIYC